MSIPNILIVDDEPGILDSCARMLRRQGFDVTTASNAKTAKTLLQSQDIDLLITDIQMPGEDGISMLQTVRENSPDLPVIVITAYPEPQYIDAVIDLNVQHFIPKPFNLISLVNEVKRNLDIEQTLSTVKDGPSIDELTTAFIDEMQRRQIPLLRGTIQEDKDSDQIVLVPTGSEGRIPVGQWLLEYTGGQESYVIVIPISED